MPGEFDAEFDAAPDAAALDAEFDAAPDAPGQNASIGSPATIKTPYQSPYGPKEYAQANPGVWDSIKGGAIGLGEELWGRGQQFSGGMLRGAMGAPPEANTLSIIGHGLTPAIPTDTGKVLAGRAMQINPLIAGSVGDRAFETPEAHKAARGLQQNLRDITEADPGMQAFFSPQGRERAADTVAAVLQTGASAIPSAIPVVGGINVSAQLAAKIGGMSPRLAALVLGAVETSSQNIAMGVLGAEKGERLATLKALMSPPNTFEEYLGKVALPLVGGVGAAAAVRGLAREKSVKSLGDEYVGGQTEREFVEFMHAKGSVPEAKFSGRQFDSIPKTEKLSAQFDPSGPSGTLTGGQLVQRMASKAVELSQQTQQGIAERRAKFVAVVNADHIRALADDMEYNTAMAKGELLLRDPDATARPRVHEEAEAPFSWLAHQYKKDLVEAPLIGGEKGGAHYQFDKVVPDELDFTAESSGVGVRDDPNISLPFPGKEGVRAEGQLLPLTKRDVRVDAAVKGATKHRVTSGLKYKGPTGDAANNAVAKAIARHRNLPREYDLPENPFEYGARPRAPDELAGDARRRAQEAYATAELARGADPHQLARDIALWDRDEVQWRRDHPVEAAENGPSDPLAIPLGNLANTAAKHKNSPFSPFKKLHPETRKDVLDVSRADPQWHKAVKKGLRKRRVAQQAAVVEAPDAKKGVAGVIEWSDGTVEVQNIDNVADAHKFRTALSKSRGRPDVGLSTKAEALLAREPDQLLHDALVLSPKERMEGKTTGGSVSNRASVLMMNIDDGIPFLTSVKDPVVRAVAARNLGIVGVNTADGVRFAQAVPTREGFALLPLDEGHGLPTLPDGVLPLAATDVGVVHVGESSRDRKAQPLTGPEWEFLFTEGRIPTRLSEMDEVGPAGPLLLRLQAASPELPTTRVTQNLSVREAFARHELAGAFGKLVTGVPSVHSMGFGKRAGDVKPTPNNPLPGDLALSPSLSPHAAGLVERSFGGGDGGGGGPPRKPPTGPPEPPPEPLRGPVRHDAVSEGSSAVLRGAIGLVAPDQMNLWQRAGRKLIGAHLRGPIDLQDALILRQSEQAAAAFKDNWLASLHRASPRAPRSSLAYHADAVKLGQGKMTTDQFIALYPEARAAKQLFDDAARRKKVAEARLIEEYGMINPKPETLMESPEYLATLTLAHMMKGKDALKFSKSLERGKVWQDAIKGYIDEQQKAGHIIDEVTAEVYLEGLIGGDDPVGNYSVQGSGNAKAKKDMPDWLRKVMGQGLSGELAIAHTLGVQEAALVRGEVFRKIASRPDWVGTDAGVLAASIGMNPKKMPESRWLYGDLAGKYVHPHIYDVTVLEPQSGTLAAAHRSIANQPNALYSGLRSVARLIKGNEIANPATIFNSFIGNWYHMVLSGIAPTEFPRYGQNMEWAARALLDFRKNPIAEAQYAKPQEGVGNLSFMVREARHYGFDAEGFGTTEVSRREISNIQETFLRAVAKDGGIDQWAGLIRGFKAVIGLPGSFTSKAGAVLDLTDRLHKMAAGFTLAEQALKRAKNGEKGFVGVIRTRQDALRWAARRVNKAFPMPDRTGLYPRYAADTAGVVNPYITYIGEVIRTSAQAPSTIIEDPRVMLSIGAWGMTTAGMYAIYKNANPVDSKLIEEERKTRREYSGTYEPTVVPMMFTASNGRPILANATPFFDITRYLAGDRTMSVAERVVGNAILGFTDRGILGPLVEDGLATIDPRWEKYEKRKKIWQAGWEEAANRLLMDSGVLPKYPGKVWRSWNKTNPVPFNPYSPKQQQPWEIPAMQAAGLPILDQQAPLSHALQPKMQMGQVRRDIQGRLMEPEGFQTGPIPSQDSVGEDFQSIFDVRMRQK